MKPLRDWRAPARTACGVSLTVDSRHALRVAVLDHDLIRVSLLKDGVWRLGRSWCVAPEGDMPWAGRSRDDAGGFPRPDFGLEQTPDALILTTEKLRLRIARPLRLTWESRIGGRWRALAADRPASAYMLGVRDHAHGHFMTRAPGERIYGLGEKTGDLERGGRRFEMRNLDALGYDARRTDPLYKHIPFTLTRTATAGSYGMFYDNLATCRFDLGNEIDNYHPPYRAYRADDGDLDFYLSWSPDLLGLVKRQVGLTGGTAFAPRWSLGYSGSAMSYADAPDAQAQVEGFLEKIDAHDIPCDSFQLSSGYSSIDGKRYVFTWNRRKFPDPKALAARFAARGVRLIANVKPCLLRDHPRYAEAAREGLFIRDSETDAPERSAFWDDEGSHLDFTNPATIAWWRRNVTEQLLDKGVAATWNDNNEYEVWDHEARCHGFGESIPAGLIRPLHAILMARASQEAQLAHAPGKRPHLISRSGAPGIQRHAQTWTGDNRTSWDTLRCNIRMGLGLSLSGIFNIGHDVGGFAGPRPDAELFLRWVQNGVFHPRFTIHSWNDDGSVNEPWMHPRVLDRVRDAMRLRCRLTPYLYTCLWRAVRDREPMLRPTFLDHEHDARCFDDTDDFMLGRDLLVANVVEPGARERRVWLPDNGVGWRDFQRGTWHAPGRELRLPVDLGSIPLFVRAGAVLPLADDPPHGAGRFRAQDFALFPAPGAGRRDSLRYEDDGDSAAALDGDHCLTRITLDTDADEIRLDWSHAGRLRPAPDSIPDSASATVRILLPEGEGRALRVNGRPARPGARVAFAPSPRQG